MFVPQPSQPSQATGVWLPSVFDFAPLHVQQLHDRVTEDGHPGRCHLLVTTKKMDRGPRWAKEEADRRGVFGDPAGVVCFVDWKCWLAKSALGLIWGVLSLTHKTFKV